MSCSSIVFLWMRETTGCLNNLLLLPSHILCPKMAVGISSGDRLEPVLLCSRAVLTLLHASRVTTCQLCGILSPKRTFQRDGWSLDRHARASKHNCSSRLGCAASCHSDTVLLHYTRTLLSFRSSQNSPLCNASSSLSSQSRFSWNLCGSHQISQIPSYLGNVHSLKHGNSSKEYGSQGNQSC